MQLGTAHKHQLAQHTVKSYSAVMATMNGLVSPNSARGRPRSSCVLCDLLDAPTALAACCAALWIAVLERSL